MNTQAQQAQDGSTKAVPNGDTIPFVTKKIKTLREILATKKAADLSPELRYHFQLLVKFVGQATSIGVYSPEQVGSTPEEIKQFVSLLD